MKILHVIDSAGIYGAETVVLSLMHEQRAMGLEPRLCSIGHLTVGEKAIETEASRRGFHVEKVRMRNGPNITGALRIIRFAVAEGMQVIHAHGYKADILLGFMPKRVRGVPMVATVHGWTSTKPISRISLYEWLDRQSLKFLEVIILVSESMRPKLKVGGAQGQRIMVINNGLQAWQPNNLPSIDDPEISDFCGEGFTIGSVGRLSPEKGYDVLIKALHALVSKGLDVRLLLIGEGPDRGILETLIDDYSLNEHAFLPGYRENGRDYMSLFDVFVLPSFTEGMPLALLEAMGAGRAIIATSVGAVPDLLEDGRAGLLVEPGDSGALADAISSMYHERDLRDKLSAKAKAAAEIKYSSRKMAEQYQTAYELAIGSY
jgi:glycosyltransferase involved in cell wall biosynthesis